MLTRSTRPSDTRRVVRVTTTITTTNHGNNFRFSVFRIKYSRRFFVDIAPVRADPDVTSSVVSPYYYESQISGDIRQQIVLAAVVSREYSHTTLTRRHIKTGRPTDDFYLFIFFTSAMFVLRSREQQRFKTNR